MARPHLTAEQREQTREAIRLHALALYREGGLEAVSVRAVATQAGLSPASIYSYFPTLRALIESLWREPVVNWLGEMQSVAGEIQDPTDRLRTIVKMYTGFAIDNREIYRAALLHVRPAHTLPPDVQPLTGLPLHTMLRDTIEEAQASGSVRAGNADIMAQAIWASLHGAIALPVHMEAWGVATASELAAEVSENLMRGLKADGP